MVKRLSFVAIALVILVLVSAILYTSPPADALAAQSQPYQQYQLYSAEAEEEEFPIMRPSPEEKLRWTESYQQAPRTQVARTMTLQLEKAPGGSLSLLDHLQYTPAQRNQGCCGNCWVWAGTGVMEIALDEQTGIKDRLSIQYFNSNYNGGSGYWACCGGWLAYLAGFYAGTEKAIPWSNTNASYADGGRTCSSGSTSVPAGTISTSPCYAINSITAETIPTYGLPQETAIANIKDILNQNRAVWFAFFLADGSDSTNFRNFWWHDPESSIWNPDFTCGKTYDFMTGGGHAVLCVGYNDEDPDNCYWIMVNSWGITSGRPNGIFYLDMDMNYSCAHAGPAGGQAFFWQTLDVTFAPDTPSVLGSYQTRGSSRFYEWAGSRWQVIRGGMLHITHQDGHKIEGYWEPQPPIEGWPALVSVKGYVGSLARNGRGRISNTPRLSLVVELGEYCQYPSPTYVTYILNAKIRMDRKTEAVKSIRGAINGWGEWGAALDDNSASLGQFEGRFTATPTP